MKSKIILGITELLILTGCSMMPYHENFICEGGSNFHICKSVSDVYKESENGTLYKDLNKTNKTNPKTKIIVQECSKCKDLKNIIEAISYEELKKPEEIVIINHYKVIKTNKTNKIIPLNKEVKVCVYNANIRALPSCQAKILKTAHKGEKLFAYYLKGAWIKVKGGWIHKSLVCGGCKCEK